MPVPSFISLSDLTNQIKGVLKDAFAGKSYWVVADITDHKFYPAKGTHYFSLAEKDPRTHTLSAKIAAVAWSDGGAIAINSFQKVTGEKFRNNFPVPVNFLSPFNGNVNETFTSCKKLKR